MTENGNLAHTTTVILKVTRHVASTLPFSVRNQVMGELEALERELEGLGHQPDQVALTTLAHEVERFGNEVKRVKRMFAPEPQPSEPQPSEPQPSEP